MFSCEFYEIFSRTPPVSARFKSEFLSAICQTCEHRRSEDPQDIYDGELCNSR